MTRSTLRQGLRVPTGWRDPTSDLVRVEIPAAIQHVKARDGEAAGAWRYTVRAAMSRCFELGYVAVDVVREPDEQAASTRAFYVLRHDPA